MTLTEQINAIAEQHREKFGITTGECFLNGRKCEDTLTHVERIKWLRAERRLMVEWAESIVIADQLAEELGAARLQWFYSTEGEELRRGALVTALEQRARAARAWEIGCAAGCREIQELRLGINRAQQRPPRFGRP